MSKLESVAHVLGKTPASHVVVEATRSSPISIPGYKPTLGSVSKQPQSSVTALDKSKYDMSRLKKSISAGHGGRSNSNAPRDSVVLHSPDQRTLVSDPTAWPYCVLGRIVSVYADGSWTTGSGALINRHHVLTAGHVVYQPSLGGWPQSAAFAPALSDASAPYGAIMATNLLSNDAWVSQGDPTNDYGCLILDTDIGNSTGWMGMASYWWDAALKEKQATVTGYPGDKTTYSTEMWTASNIIALVLPEQFTHLIDTAGGESGSPVWCYDDNNQPTILGVHTGGDLGAGINVAARISSGKLDFILKEWIAKY